MGRLDGGDDPLGFGQILKGLDGLVVGDGDVLRAARVVQHGVLGAHARIVEACRNRVDGRNLPVLVLAEVGFHAVEDAQPANADGGGCLEGVDARPAASQPMRATSLSAMKW